MLTVPAGAQTVERQALVRPDGRVSRTVVRADGYGDRTVVRTDHREGDGYGNRVVVRTVRRDGDRQWGDRGLHCGSDWGGMVRRCWDDLAPP